MRIISRKKLRQFWELHEDVREIAQAWYHDVQRAVWKTPNDIKDEYRNVSIIAYNRVVFNLKGNKYRLVIKVQ
jgi:mRNA interferase HigB